MKLPPRVIHHRYDYYTVLFGVSCAFGALAQLFWDRVLMLPLERPKSVTSDWIRDHFKVGRARESSAY